MNEEAIVKTDITVAKTPDLPLVMDILAEAAAWLQSRGIDQWPSPPNEHWRRRMAGKIAAGEMHLVRHAGQVVGIVGLSWHDDYWPDDGEAGYVHRMAVRDAWHGRELGGEILAWASKSAQSRGCSLLRLDCLPSNRRLCHYYQRQGFERRAEIVGRDNRAVLYLRAEVRWPGTVEIGTRVEQIGRSSLTLKQALFQGDRLVATAETVIVLMDEETRRSTPLPPATVDTLKKLMVAHDS